MPGHTKTEKRKKRLTVGKAKKILRDNSAHGKPLTDRQKGLFGLIAGGEVPTRLKRKSASRNLLSHVLRGRNG